MGVGEGGVAGSSATLASGQALGVDLAMAGLSVGGFVAEVDHDAGLPKTAAGRSVESTSDITAYVKYTAGPVSFGYQQGYISRGHKAVDTATTAAKYVSTAGGHFETESMS